ncbi:MAG TPA: glycoside hydrolase family 16 protein [Pseudomonadales bacterium]|nr:glycoside hydrolase family 16 protein [Pseudomonadales bacterium]
MRNFFVFLREVRVQRLALVFTLFAFPILATSAFGNVLSNASFESGFTNWSTYGPNNYIVSGTAQAGSSSYKAYGSFIGATNFACVYQDNVSTPGAIYSANGWINSLSTDAINGQDQIWLEVSFRDSSYNALAVYRSPVITAANIASFGGFGKWINLQITNRCSITNPSAFFILASAVTNTATSLTAPAGTAYVCYLMVFEQGPDNANGSMYYDNLTLNQTGGTQVPNPTTQWNIVWSDEFNGKTINTNIWAFETGNNGGWGNNELEYYTSNSLNAYVTNGLLHIVALQQSTNGYSYTSARMKTQNNFSTTYGRIVWRAALPAGTGMWPALWMLGSNFSSVGWPACGEIDVMEENGTYTNQVQSTIHSGNVNNQDAYETALYTLPSGNNATNFHTYMVQWQYGSISFSVDGNVFETQTTWGSPNLPSPNSPYPTPFNAPFFLLMNLAVGGNYVGNPSITDINSGTVFPAQILVDYVRVYELTAPMALTVTKQSNSLKFTWPTNIVAHLQAQTNSLQGTWYDVANSTNPFVLSPPLSNAPVFYRLESP